MRTLAAVLVAISTSPLGSALWLAALKQHDSQSLVEQAKHTDSLPACENKSEAKPEERQINAPSSPNPAQCAGQPVAVPQNTFEQIQLQNTAHQDTFQPNTFKPNTTKPNASQQDGDKPITFPQSATEQIVSHQNIYEKTAFQKFTPQQIAPPNAQPKSPPQNTLQQDISELKESSISGVPRYPSAGNPTRSLQTFSSGITTSLMDDPVYGSIGHSRMNWKRNENSRRQYPIDFADVIQTPRTSDSAISTRDIRDDWTYEDRTDDTKEESEAAPPPHHRRALKHAMQPPVSSKRSEKTADNIFKRNWRALKSKIQKAFHGPWSSDDDREKTKPKLTPCRKKAQEDCEKLRSKCEETRTKNCEAESYDGCPHGRCDQPRCDCDQPRCDCDQYSTRGRHNHCRDDDQEDQHELVRPTPRQRRRESQYERDSWDRERQKMEHGDDYRNEHLDKARKTVSPNRQAQSEQLENHNHFQDLQNSKRSHQKLREDLPPAGRHLPSPKIHSLEETELCQYTRPAITVNDWGDAQKNGWTVQTLENIPRLTLINPTISNRQVLWLKDVQCLEGNMKVNVNLVEGDIAGLIFASKNNYDTEYYAILLSCPTASVEVKYIDRELEKLLAEKPSNKIAPQFVNSLEARYRRNDGMITVKINGEALIETNVEPLDEPIVFGVIVKQGSPFFSDYSLSP